MPYLLIGGIDDAVDVVVVAVVDVVIEEVWRGRIVNCIVDAYVVTSFSETVFAVVDDMASISVDVFFSVGFGTVGCVVLNTCDVVTFDVTCSVLTFTVVLFSLPLKYMH